MDFFALSIPGPDTDAMEAAWRHADDLLMPRGAMGRCHDIAVWVAGIQRTPMPRIERPGLWLAAGDHGVVEAGVTAYPSEVTRQMVEVFLQGGGTCNTLVRALNGIMAVINAGVRGKVRGRPASPEVVAFIDEPVREGTRNFLDEPALTPEEVDRAIRLGYETARAFILRHGIDVLAVGEMGIGNTTAAAVLTAWRTGQDPASVVGPGADLPPDRWEHKRRVVRNALERHRASVRTPLDALACWGGLEICAMVGAYLACAHTGVIAVVDGFISTVAAVWAVDLAPGVRPYLIASHRSAEPGHRYLLAAMAWEPLLDLRMRLGEGTGALMAIPLIRMAAAIHRETWTFRRIGLQRA